MISVYEQMKILILYTLLGLFLGIMHSSISFITKNFKLLLKYLFESISYLLLIIISSIFIINNTDLYLGIYSIVFITVGLLLFYIFIYKSYISNLNKISIYLVKNKDKYHKVLGYIKNILLPVELFTKLFRYIKLLFILIYLKIKKIIICFKQKAYKKKQTNM